MSGRQSILAVFASALWLIGWPFASAHAFTATDAGVEWLNSVQTVDGYWGKAFGGTPIRDTTAAVNALRELSPASTSYARAVQWLLTTDPLVTDYTARSITALAGTGNDLTTSLTALKAAQHADGGWGLDADHESDPLDTELALQALAATNTTDGVAQAVSFLLARQQLEGSWSDSEGQPSAFITANAFRALWSYRNSYIGVSAALGKAQTFLVSRQDASGAWDENFDTALALIAIIPQVTDLSLIKASVSVLQAAQLANGSWEDDLLALRARESEAMARSTR